MMQRLQQHWQEFRSEEPGRRFEAQYQRRRQRRRHPAMRVLRVLLALVLMAAGLFMLATPGPGMVALAVGLSLLAHESLWVARGLDRLEVWARPGALAAWRWWKPQPSAVRLALLGLAGAFGMAAGYLVWRLLG